jgi:sugar lactone lactonase YvrE
MKKALQTISPKIAGIAGAALLLMAAGCASQPKAKEVHVFFPPPPDEPRIQYLMSFGSESALGGRGKFADFVMGGQTIHRPILKPYGVTTTKGKIYICDTQAAAVETADLVKRTLRYLKPTGEAMLAVPINVAVDKDGTKYVTDTKREEVLMFDSANAYLGTLGQKGKMKPCGIAVAGDRLYVSDLKNHCVRVYRKANRELLFSVPRDPADEKAKLHSPTNLAVDQQGRLYVSDTGGFMVQIYDADGKHLRGIGEQGITPGRFALPKGIGVDRAGRIYIVDAATAVAQVFDNDGRLLMFFGDPKTSGPGSLYLPAGLAIDYENVDLFQKYVAPGRKLEFLILVINQAGPQKVSVYGFLAKK